MSRTSRLFLLLDALRAHRRPITAARIASDLQVSARTVYRDIQTLIELGAPIEGEAGIGYVLRTGFFLPPLMFDEDELDALVLGARWVEKNGDPGLVTAARTALSKIATASPHDLRDTIAGQAMAQGPYDEAETLLTGTVTRVADNARHRNRKTGITVRLYINRLSSNSRRAEMTARYLQSPVEFSIVDLVKQEQRQPAFLKLNPLGKVPVLEDDGFMLTESLVAGSALTLADFALAAPLMSTVPAKLPVTQFANLQAWYHRVQALDVWKEAS